MTLGLPIQLRSRSIWSRPLALMVSPVLPGRFGLARRPGGNHVAHRSAIQPAFKSPQRAVGDSVVGYLGDFIVISAPAAFKDVVRRMAEVFVNHSPIP